MNSPLPRSAHKALDVSAVSLSFVCMLHCLAPVVALAGVPLFVGSGEGHESFHLMSVIAASAVTLPALWMARRSPAFAGFAAMAVTGLCCLALALTLPMHWAETAMTSIGGLFLAAAHLRNLRAARRAPAH